MDSKKQRVAIYVRVSTEEQAVEGVSIDAQLAILRSHGQSRGWEVVDEYVDAGYGGGTDERPALQRLINDARQGRFDIIAVGKLDRFFRNLRLLLNHLYDLEQLGIKFVATQEMLDTSTPNGRFTVQIMGVIAEFERGRIGERVRDSRQYMIARGDWPGGHTPYGYRWLNDDKRWEVVTAEADTVRFIFDRYSNRDSGIDAIARALNEEGIHTRSGARWRYSNVRGILTHPGYKGRHTLGMPMPVIVDEATWQRAQHKRENARRVLRKAKGWLLQGMCICGKCGHVLKCLHQKPKEPRYYACRGRVERRHLDRDERCDLPYVRAEDLELAVWRKVQDVLRDRQTLSRCVNDGLVELEDIRSHLKESTLAIDDKLNNVRTKLERLGMAFADGAVTEKSYRLKLGVLKKLEASLLRRRRDIDPAEAADLAEVEGRISFVQKVLEAGTLNITDFGIFGSIDDKYFPAGFNAFRETDGELAIGEVVDMDYFRVDGIEHRGRLINAPPAFFECDDPEKQKAVITENRRAMLQLFGVKVHVFPDRVEVRGSIPTQVLGLVNAKPEPTETTGSIISSPS